MVMLETQPQLRPELAADADRLHVLLPYAFCASVSARVVMARMYAAVLLRDDATTWHFSRAALPMPSRQSGVLPVSCMVAEQFVFPFPTAASACVGTEDAGDAEPEDDAAGCVVVATAELSGDSDDDSALLSNETWLEELLRAVERSASHADAHRSLVLVLDVTLASKHARKMLPRLPAFAQVFGKFLQRMPATDEDDVLLLHCFL